MPMELDMVKLSEQGRSFCRNTIGPNTFFMLVADALVSGEELSVVRMGDGEKALFEHCQNNPGTTITDAPWGAIWLHSFGCYGINADVLLHRLKDAAEGSTYFAPQIMGIQRPEFGVVDTFESRPRFVDNWFVRQWSKKLQDQLFKQAGQVLFIHGSQEVRQKVAARIESAGATAECWEMETWEQGDPVIDRAKEHNAPLVLFSGGPANKYIAPAIARSGPVPKVVLDLGQAAAMEWT